MYTPNLHIGILDDTEVVGALCEFVIENCQNFTCQINMSLLCQRNSVLCDAASSFLKLHLFSSPSEKISQM